MDGSDLIIIEGFETAHAALRHIGLIHDGLPVEEEAPASLQELGMFLHAVQQEPLRQEICNAVILACDLSPSTNEFDIYVELAKLEALCVAAARNPRHYLSGSDERLLKFATRMDLIGPDVVAMLAEERDSMTV